MKSLLRVSVLALVLPVLAAAQEPARTISYLCSEDIIRRDQLIRVHQQQGSVIGPLVRCEADFLILGPHMGQDRAELPIPYTTVDRLWVRGSQWKIGLASGFLAGALLGYSIQSVKSNLCSGPAGGDCHGKRLASTFVGAALGGFVGWALGSGLPRWVRRFP